MESYRWVSPYKWVCSLLSQLHHCYGWPVPTWLKHTLLNSAEGDAQETSLVWIHVFLLIHLFLMPAHRERSYWWCCQIVVRLCPSLQTSRRNRCIRRKQRHTLIPLFFFFFSQAMKLLTLTDTVITISFWAFFGVNPKHKNTLQYLPFIDTSQFGALSATMRQRAAIWHTEQNYMWVKIMNEIENFFIHKHMGKNIAEKLQEGSTCNDCCTEN